MTDDKTKGMDYPYVDDRVASLSALIAELRVRVNVLDVQMVAIHEAHPETASRLSPSEQERYRRIREKLPATYPEAATPFDERGRCDHYNAERDTCAVQKLHVGFVSDTGSCFLSKGCEHRQVDGVDREDPLQPVRTVADIHGKPVDEADMVGQAVEKHYREKPLDPIRELVEELREEATRARTVAGIRDQRYLEEFHKGERDTYWKVLQLIDQHQPTSQPCPHCGDTSGERGELIDLLEQVVRWGFALPLDLEHDEHVKYATSSGLPLDEACTLLARLRSTTMQPCPHCGDTSQDPGHFEDCPERKTEDAPVLWADHGRCDHYSRDTSICAVSNERIPQDEDGWCCGTHNCDQREIDGKTRDKGGD